MTVIGSALMLIGFLILHAKTGTFDLIALRRSRRGIDHATQVADRDVLPLGFGAKVPMWPLHFWLPDAHSKAPTVGSVLLAGVLLKLGTYGLLRFWYDVVPVRRPHASRPISERSALSGSSTAPWPASRRPTSSG